MERNRVPFSKILVANRGEIALRVIRACREMGIASVAVYSEADAGSLPVRMADEAVCIGPAVSARSYLNAEAILQAAEEKGAQAVHPGYGYLAEKASFARECAARGFVFIGPAPESMRLAGDKITAKRIVQEAGVPVIPGGTGAVADPEEARRVGLEVGYPVMIKASGGGGGRGIRVCRDETELAEHFRMARIEGRTAFGNDEVYVEKYIEAPRHVEFQILADGFGRVVHLGERECSVQRRYQKLIEEAPSPAVTPELRERMGEAAVRAARAVRYVNAGTVEFLLAPDGRFYFMEINARIQVEHPVTEMITGIDIVKEQIRIAAGAELGFSSRDIMIRGWALECRINAEDPDNRFLPSPGTVAEYHPPGGYGVRLDTHLFAGYELPPFYDSLAAKLITYDRTRQGAIRIMRRALDEFVIRPIKTTLPLHRRILDDPAFLEGRLDTGFIERFIPEVEDDEEDEA
jgi:acetyl-CoA carboxylase, biotin carboxylase subunit